MATRVIFHGPAAVHDRVRPMRTGGSFAPILHSLKYHRNGADVVVRVDAAVGIAGVEELADVLDGEGLFSTPNPLTMYVARRARYREQARDLLLLLPRLGSSTRG